VPRKTKPGRKPLPRDPGPFLADLYKTLTFREIMAEYDVSYKRLRAYLDSEDAVLRRAVDGSRDERGRFVPGIRSGVQPPLLPATPAMIADYHRTNLARAAEKHDISRERLHKRLQAANVVIRNRGRQPGTRVRGSMVVRPEDGPS
jgi:hypothetical protein